MDKEGSQLIRGLEGVVAAETRLCDLDGANGRLGYCGYATRRPSHQPTTASGRAGPARRVNRRPNKCFGV